MRKGAGSVLTVVSVFTALGICGIGLAKYGGAIGSVVAAAGIAGLASVLVVRGLLKE